MSKIRILVALFSALVFVEQIDAQIYEADRMLKTLNVIRSEKFDYVLPGAMRDHKIDMWIQERRGRKSRSPPIGPGQQYRHFCLHRSGRRPNRTSWIGSYVDHRSNLWSVRYFWVGE